MVSAVKPASVAPETSTFIMRRSARGNLIELCQACLPWIGEIQVADVPGRCEPGTGEINYAGVARALQRMGYDGPVAMEAFAAGDELAALDAFSRGLYRNLAH